MWNGNSLFMVEFLMWNETSSENINRCQQKFILIWYGILWSSMVSYGMVWYGMVIYGIVWYGMVWYGIIWYGMISFGMV